MTARNLPPRMHEKDGGFYYVRWKQGKAKWTHLGNELEAARMRYNTIEHTIESTGDMNIAWSDLQKYYSQTYHRAKKNARIRKIQFDLTSAQFKEITARANGLCEASGIPFDLRVRPRSLRRPFAPSLDRADASGIYEMSNCRLICGIVNAAMSDWGDVVFWKMVKSAKRKARGCQIELEALTDIDLTKEALSD